ncbi:MAG: aspartate aminotransferase family protein [Gammaproteobacteria bacterium]
MPTDASATTPAEMLALKTRYLVPCVYHFYREPMVLERGEGCYVFDSAGRRYLDCYSGVGVTSAGHANPVVVEAAIAQLKRLAHTTTIYLTEPMLRLAEELAAFLPETLAQSFFCTSGSEANEGALLLAKLATGRNDFVALSRSLHGRTYLTAGLTGMSFWRTDPSPPDNVHFVPSPTCHDCPLALDRATCGLRCADRVGELLDEHPGEIAALIAEPIHGNGGIEVPPPGYFERVQAHLRRHGVLLIMDEAQTGFCRTGKRFGFEHWDVAPDIVTVCKALGNGLPIAAFIATREVAAAYTRPGASTFGGNLVCSEAARAVLAFMRAHDLDTQAAARGAQLEAGLRSLAATYALIDDVRGLGLMRGVELVEEDGSPASAATDALLESLKARGVLAGKTGPGRNVLTLMPPLVIEAAQIDTLLDTLAAAFEEVTSRRSRAA